MKRFTTFKANSFSSSIRLHTYLSPENSNVTRIRIWKSGYYTDNNVFVHTSVASSILSFSKSNKRPNIGHVSIETKDIYASLWPEGLTLFNKFKPQDGSANKASPNLDEDAEGRPPDHCVDLQTLNVSKIKNKLMQFDQSGSTYHLIGRNRFFTIKGLQANSCSGLAYDLLVEGGIKDLITTPHFIRDYVVVTPNNLSLLILEAKENELLKSEQVRP